MKGWQDRWRTWALAVAGLAALLSACLSTPPVRLYLLTSQASGIGGLGGQWSGWQETTIGVGPVLLPEYLNRPQIVTRISDTHLVAADAERWAEPLTANVQRVLSENLAAQLGTNLLLTYPWKKSEAPEYQVRVEILRLDAGPEALVSLRARWSIVGRDGNLLVGPQLAEIDRASVLDYEVVVQAESQALSEFSQGIAQELRRLAARRHTTP